MTARSAILAGLLLTATGMARAASGMAHLSATAEGSILGGHLTLEDTPKGLRVSGTLSNVPAGEHGFHIHEFGDCSDMGNKAGGHYNPDSHPHGHAVKDASSAHPGDMGNVTAGKDGSAKVDLVLPNAMLSAGKYPVAGRAIVLHEKKDDFGQPTGNAGGRIACGPILITGK